MFTGGSLLYGTVGRTDLVAEVRDRGAHAGPVPVGAPSRRSAPRRRPGVSDPRVRELLRVGQEQRGLRRHPRHREAHQRRLHRRRRGRLRRRSSCRGSAPTPLLRPHGAAQPGRGRSPSTSRPRCRSTRPSWPGASTGASGWSISGNAARSPPTTSTGTIGIELADPFSTYLGWLIPWGTALTLLAETAEQVTEAQRQLVRIGIDRPRGAAHGADRRLGRRTATDAATPWSSSPTSPASSPRTVTYVLDVRRDDEWAEGHIDDAIHLPDARARRPRGARSRTAGLWCTAPAVSGPASPPASSTEPAATSCSSTTSTTTRPTPA